MNTLLILLFIYVAVSAIYHQERLRIDNYVSFSELYACAKAKRINAVSEETEKALNYFSKTYTAKNSKARIIAKNTSLISEVVLFVSLSCIVFVKNSSCAFFWLKFIGVISGILLVISIAFYSVPLSKKKKRLTQLKNIYEIFGTPDDRLLWIAQIEKSYSNFDLKKKIRPAMLPFMLKKQFNLTVFVMDLVMSFAGVSLVSAIIAIIITIVLNQNIIVMKILITFLCVIFLLALYPTRLILFGSWSGGTKQSTYFQIIAALHDVKNSLPEESA